MAILKVQNLDQFIAMTALKGGLQKNDLLFLLEKKFPQDFADTLTRAERYAQAKEVFRQRDANATKECLVGEHSKSSTPPKNRGEGRRCFRMPLRCR